MHCTCYLRKDVAYLPTLGKVHRGPYHAIEPVAVAPVSDREALRAALGETWRRGNPPLPRRNSRPEPSQFVVLKYAGVKTKATFWRGVSCWGLDENDGLYKITKFKNGPHGGWVPDRDQEVQFPAGTNVETFIDRVIAILQSAHAG
jgi:hypothetical protein